MKEKKEYFEPEMNIVCFGSEDVITSSPANDNDPFVDDWD